MSIYLQYVTQKIEELYFKKLELFYKEKKLKPITIV